MAIADVDTPAGEPNPGGDSTDGDAAHQPAPDSTGTRRARLPHFPALDGVRGIAVLAVLFFHAGFEWMKGGYLGVSTFFTLSGFLITSLLLAERGQRGRIDLKAFWTRRFRRLMPASLACLALVVVFGLVAADPTQRDQLAGGVVSALAYVANWHFILAGQSYGDLFAAPSPVLHFWSLAIEEQFYLVYPLLIFGLVGVGALATRTGDAKRRYWAQRLGRNYRDLVGAVLLVLIVVSFCLTRFAGFGQDRIYFGTDTRASELLVGGLLAVVLFHRDVTARLARKGAARTIAVAAGAVGLGIAILLWIRTPETASWLYEGGFTLYALVSALIITAAVVPVGPVRAGLALAPLRRLGVISYGVYLYHWPIFLWLRQKTDLPIWPRFLVGVAITLVLAELSFRLLEMPIRRGARIFNIRPIKVAPVAIATIAVAVIAVSVTAPPPLVDFGAAQRQLSELTSGSQAPTTAPAAPEAAPAPSVALFGDSTALMTSWGIGIHFANNPDGSNVEGWTGLGCGIVRSPQRKVGDQVENIPDICNDWQNTYTQKINAGHPDIAVVQVGPWDIADHKIPGSDQWRGPGDPEYDDYALSEMETVIDTLSAQGALVVWLTSPIPGKASIGDDQANYHAVDRTKRFNELVAQLPQQRPGKVELVDLAGWLQQQGTAEDERLRPDGTHFSRDASVEVANGWLVPSILDVWQKHWTDTHQQAAAQPASVVVVGDSTAQALGVGLDAWATDNKKITVRTSAQAACGIGRGGQRKDLTGQPEPIPDECGHWDQLYPVVLAGTPPDVVVATTSIWDVTDRDLGDGTWRTLGDEYYDQYLVNELTQATDVLHSTGAKVVWLLVPHVDPGRQPDGTSPGLPVSDPARIDRLNDLIRQVVASRSDFASTLDYAAQARAWPGGEFDPQRRPDGVTPTDVGAREIADWLAPQLVDLAKQ